MLSKRRGSKLPANDEDEEIGKYFKTKPENQVVKLGENMKVECYFAIKPPSVDWYRGAIPVKTDPRCSIVFDPEKMYSCMELKKAKQLDEAKYKIQVEDEKGEKVLDFAGFSVFVKDPKDSGLDFRNLLKHKDHKKRKGTSDDPDWGELKTHEKEIPESMRNRRLSAIDLSRGALKPGSEKEKVTDHWVDELEDVSVQEKESKLELACRYTKPTARVHWYKNKMEVFHGVKYNMTCEDGIFRLFINRIAIDDAGKYVCCADGKETSCYVTVEGKKLEYHFTQKLPKTLPVKRKKDLQLECMLSDPRGEVTWYKNGEKLEYTPGKYEISRRENRCILKIKNADPSDAAEYTCEVEGDKTSCKVTIEEPDYDFERPLTDADAYEKETAEFECEVNDEEATVQWYREDKKIDINDPKYFCVQDGKKRRLRIANISGKDEGIYKCMVQNKVTSAKLYVAPDVVIKEQLKNLRKVEGEVAKMQCKVKNPKNYPIKWFKNGKEITVPSDKYEVTEEDGRQTLTIKDLKLDDAGDYSCKIGDRETSAKLTVDEGSRAPSINLDAVPREITVRAGKKVSLEIPYTGYPKPTAKWTKNKSPLEKDENISMAQTAELCKLQIAKAKRTDAGEYEIELENKSGKVSCPITLKVIDKPSKPEGPLEVKGIYKDRCQLLWKPPLDDGGLPIDHYIVEAQESGSKGWTEVGKVREDTQCGVPDLIPGKKYKFQVRAVNSEGKSEPLATINDILAKDPFDPPGKPGRPTIVDYDKDHAEIKWSPSKSDGGSPIQKYVVEKKPKGGNWEKVGMVAPDELAEDGTLTAVVPNLEENKEYEFRVIPVNEAGPGAESDPSASVFTKNRRVKPRIDRDSFTPSIQIKRGQNFKIEVKYTGEPLPKATWKLKMGDKETKASERISITDVDYISTVVCKASDRKDTALYVIKVTNEYGSDTAEIDVVVLGPPGRPKGPLGVSDVQKDSAKISWKPPEDNGGKPIKGYKVEKMNPKTGKWEKVSDKIPPDATEFVVPKLKEGEDYKFRVSAENDEGAGEPLEAESATTIKNPFNPTDPPGKPEVVDSDRNFIKIKWEKPKKDGGAPVQGYNIERKDPRTGTWTKCNDTPVKEQEFKDDKVMPNKEYIYRVTAENEGGESKPSEPSDTIKARPLKEAPKLDLSKLAGKEIRVRAGEPINIDVPMTGSPLPLISWKKDGKDVVPSDRVKQKDGEDMASLHIPSAVRGDTGKFTITAKNDFGEDSGDIKVIVLDKPSPPQDLKAKDIFADRCTLSWKPPADDGGGAISGYLIERREEGTDLWLPIPDVVSKPEHTVKGLKAGKKYNFRVKAENAYGQSDPVELDKAILAKNPYDKPGAPGKPEVTDSDKDHITLKWSPPTKDGGAPVTGYNVERLDPKTGRWTKVNSEPITRPEFEDRKVMAGKEYEYRVTAVNAGGESEPSDSSGLLKAKPLKEAPKVNLSALGGREIRVKAGDPLKINVPISGAPTPKVAWAKDGKEIPEAGRAKMANDEENADFQIPIAQRSDTGKYAITVSNPFGENTGLINVVVLDKPGVPENLQVSDVHAEYCKLDWKPPADDGGAEITDYIVEKCEEGKELWEKVPGVVSGTAHTVRDLEPGKKYKFRVKAENMYGIGDPVVTDRAILAKNPYDAPGEPRDLEMPKFDRSSVTLKWKPPTDDGGNPIKGYQIEKCPVHGRGSWTAVNSSPVTGTTFTVPNLLEDSEWEFRVVAVNDAGPGKPSKSTGPHRVRDPIFAAGPPGTPVVGATTPNSIALTWDKPTDDGGGPILGYIVEKKPKGGDWTDANPGGLPIKDPEFVVPHLKEGEEYQFRVKAVNASGPGTPSNATAPVVAEKPAEKPSLDLSKIKDIKVKAGQELKINVPIKGWPVPKATWANGDKEIEPGGRAKIDTTDDHAVLVIKSAERGDTGPYSLKLTNPSGAAEGTINVIVLDKPSSPVGPLEATDTTPEAITLEWKPPKDDGGSRLEGYVLEKKPKGSTKWQKVPGKIGPDETKATAKNLDPGEEYDFRVMAVNENGESEPLVTSGPIKAKYPFDPPGKPGEPECTGTTEDSIALSWEPPTKDGGKPITGYVLEKREKGSKKWTRVTPNNIPGTSYNVKGLLEGHPYEFRVAAVNDAGPGQYAETSQAIKPAPPPSAPKINLDAFGKDITAAVGEPYRIKIPFTGSPVPTASWFNGPKELVESGRIKFEQTPTEVVLVCSAAEKGDQGRISVTLKNPKGSDTAQINLVIVDKPGAPEGPLEVSKVTADGCKLAWNPPKDDGGKPISHYVVEKKDKSGVWTPVSKFCRTPECEVSGLEEGEPYDFRVSAVNDQGQSEPLVTLKPIIAKHPFDPPGKPGTPVVDDVDEDSVTLSWTKPKDDGGDKIKGYVVEVKEKGSDKWTPLNAKTPCKDTKFTAQGLDKGKEYEFRVKAKNQAGLGEPSSASNPVVTKPKAGKASAPGTPTISNVGPRSMDVAWTKPALDGGSPIKGYLLEKKKPGGDWEKVSDAPIFGESAKVDNLDPGEEYEFRVAAITDVGPGDHSMASRAVKAEKPKTKPGSPENLQASDVTAESCKLSWLPPSDDGGAEVTGYLIEKCEDGTDFWEPVPASITKPSHVVKGLEPGKKYKFRVTAQNKCGLGEPCELNKAILAKNPFDAPGEPRDPEIASYDKSSVTLKWKAPLDDGGNTILGYQIEKMPARGRGSWSPVNSSPVSGTSFTVPNLAEDSEWEFRVVAVNEAGPGKPSKSLGPHKVRDQVLPCGAPGTPVVGKVTPNSVALSWDKPLKTGGSKILGYLVEMKPKGGDWTDATPGGLPVKDNEFVVPNLKEGQEYEFRVKAVNEAGPGDPSNATGPVVAEKAKEKPSIDLSKVKDISVNAGQDIKIAIPIKGWPIPTAAWEVNGKPIEKGGRVRIEVTDDQALLVISGSERPDSGTYTVRLHNDSGSAEATLGVKVLDKPGTPGGPLEAVDTSPEAITVQWKPPKDNGGSPIQGYVLEKKPKGSNKWQKVPGKIGPDETKATAKNLDPGEEYDFRVMAVNENGESEPLVTSGPIKAKYPFDVPGKCGVPEPTGTTEDSITLAWEPPTSSGGRPIKGYLVEKREPGSKRWTKVSPGDIKDNGCTVKGLTEGRPYEFRVAAINDAGVGAFVMTSEAIKPQCPASAPKIQLDGVQTDINAKVGEPFKIRIPFKGGPLPTAQFFKDGKPIAEDDRMKVEVKDGEVVLTCKSANKDDDGRYSVTLKNPKGSDSAKMNVHVLSKPGTPEGPLAVSKITPDSCKLAWNPPKTDGGSPVHHYVVEKRDKTSGKWTPVSKFCRTPECDVDDLENGEQYDFRVMAVNDEGQSEPLVTDKPITAKHPFNTPGKTGTPAIIDVDSDSVTLSWSKPSDDGGDRVKGYVVEMREKGSAKWAPLNEKTPCRDNKFTADGLEKGKEYEFRVRAKNDAGLGDPSQPSDTVTPRAKASKSSAPGFPNIDKVGRNSVDLSWTKPRSDGGSPIKGYRVEKRKPGGDWEVANPFPVMGENATVTDLDEGSEYEFRVAAITDAGPGDYSLSTAPVKVCERKPARLPEFIKKPDGCIAPLGEDAKFQVIVDGEPKPEIKWYKDGVEIRSGGKYRIVEDGEKVQLIVKGVTPGDAGDITCELSNARGKESATARLQVQTPPHLEKELREQSVDKGETLKLKIPFSGTGPFNFKLRKDGREIPDSNDKVKIIPFDDYVILQIKDADPEDTGRYKVEIGNDSGVGVCEVPIKVKATPGKCGGPLGVSDITKNACRLRWKAPEDDGGAKVTHYVVERMEVGKPYWTTVASFAKDLDFEVQGLTEHKEYMFRVAAANANGTGDWLQGDSPIIAKMPFDPPGPPGEPQAQEVGADFVSLSWDRPKSDGGGRILGYYIEKKDANADNWLRINHSPCIANIFNVPNLIEDREYDFRIFAVNEAGESVPTGTGRRIKVRDPNAATPPEIVQGLKKITCSQGKSARFEVKVHGQPAPEITWYKGTRELADSNKYQMSKEGDTYILVINGVYGEDADEYCVKATTKAGSRSSRADLVIKSPPKINVPPRFQDVATFEKGEDIVIKLPFTGNPKPTAKWLKDNVEIADNSKFKVELLERHAILTIYKAQRSDDGPYRLQLDNDLGTDSAIIKIAVNGIPDPPRFLNVEGVYHDSVMLTWKPPLNDGGGFITHYIIERKEENMTSWIRCNTSRFAFTTAENLSPCHDYQFRVMAENLYGRSEPCEPTSIVKTVTEQEGRKKKGLALEDDEGRRRRGKYDGPKPSDYDKLHYDLWDKYKPQPVDIKIGSVHDYYDICEEIGSGAFGVVHRCVEKATGRNFVGKFISTPELSDKNTVRSEIGIMNQLHHPRLLNLYDAFDDQHEMVLIQEYLSGGELFDQIADENYKMSEAEVIHYMKQICDGLRHMHEQNIVHLDIKPENILCETKKSRGVKLIDFGLSTKLDPDAVVKVSTATAEFAAPEIAEHDTVGFYTDMWAVGVLGYILLSGLSPFAGRDDHETLEHVKRCDWNFDSDAFKSISDDAKDFIKKLLVKTPQKRLTIHEALSHPWLAEDHSDYNSRIPSSRYSKFRERIREKYADWPAPMPAIGRIANYSSLRRHRPLEYNIYDTYFDRKEFAPRFVRKPRNTIVQEGNVAIFKCKVIAGSPPVITWHFGSTVLNPSLKYMPKYAGNEYELRIGRCKMEDKGEYIVKAVNSFGSKEERAILGVEMAPPNMARRAMSVEPTSTMSTRRRTFLEDFDEFKEPTDVKPRFVFQLRDRFIQEGIGFKLLATIEGNPEPKIVWRKNGKELKSGEHCDLSYSLGICSLEIHSCQPSDAGLYSCTAENMKGSTESSCKVTVNEKKVYRPSTFTDSSSITSIYSSGGGGGYSSSSSSSLSYKLPPLPQSSSSYSSSVRTSRSSTSGGGYRSSYKRTEYSRSTSSVDRWH